MGLQLPTTTPSTNFYLYLCKDNVQVNSCSEIQRLGFQTGNLEDHDPAYNTLEVSKYCVQNKTGQGLEMTGHEACLHSGVSGKDVRDWRKSRRESPKAGINLARAEDTTEAGAVLAKVTGEEVAPVLRALYDQQLDCCEKNTLLLLQHAREFFSIKFQIRTRKLVPQD